MRVKIILPNFIAVLILGLGSYFYLRVDLQRRTEEDMAQQISVVSSLFARSEGLRGFELLNNVRIHAMSRNMVKAFEKVSIPAGEGQTQAQIDAAVGNIWFRKCVDAIKKYTDIWQKQYGKRPELVVLTDRRGVALARNTTPNACPVNHNIASGMPVVERALDGEATFAIWSVDDSPFSRKKQASRTCQLMNTSLLELAAAPIWLGDDIAGTLVVGFEISNGTAMKHAEMIDMDVAILKGGEVYSSSLGTDTARQSLEQQIAHPEVRRRLDEAVKGGRLSEVFHVRVEGASYLAQLIPMANAEADDRVATVVLASLERAGADLASLRMILVLMAAMLLCVFIAGIILANHFLKPVMAIEEGILKVINGEYHYRFDVESAEVGGLSFRINQMIGALTELDEDTDGPGEVTGEGDGKSSSI